MRRPGSWVDAAVALSVTAGYLGLYGATMTPGLAYSGGDGAELTVAAATLGVAHPTGYPLYTWVAWLFIHLVPIGDIAHRTNLVSVVVGAAAVGMLYLVARRLGQDRVPAAAAAALFGASTTFWSQAVITEVYAPNVFMLALALWLALVWSARTGEPGAPRGADRLFPLFALVYGLSLGTHLSNLGFGPAYAIFVLLTDWRILTRPRTVALAVGAFLLGAAQFAWLPLRAHVNDLFPNMPPDTPGQFWRYTLNAFSALRFSFPLSALPGRLGTYAALLWTNFGLLGIGLGLAGMWACWWWNLRAFWLLTLMWGVHVTFFTQLFVPDPEPFFIASNALFALFIGFGVQAFAVGLGRLLERRAPPPRAAVSAATVTALLLALPLGVLVRTGFAANDRRTDTTMADFYHAAFALMPAHSVLVAGRGAFGADVFYWRHLYRERPDLIVASERNAPDPPPGALRFSTQPRLPVGVPRSALPENGWYVPVLFGNRFDLVLYRVQREPPVLTSPDPPAVAAPRRFADLTLVGWTVTPAPHPTDRHVHVETHWRLGASRAVVLVTQVGDVTLESHMLGLGNLARYDEQIGMPPDAVVVDSFDVVLPSWLPRGMHPVRVGVVSTSTAGLDVVWTDVGTVAVE